MPTIKDIAREAGVSHGTVSNVINGRGNVSVEKIQLVWQAAEKLGYKVNSKAQSLRQGQDRSIAVLLPSIEDRRWAAMYEVFQNEFIRHGYSVQLYSTRSMETTEKELLAAALAERVSAVISRSCLLDAAAYYRAEAPELPIVLLSRESRALENVMYAAFDPERMGTDIAWHLRRKGLRRIGIFTEPAAFPDTALFLNGFRTVCADETSVLDCPNHQVDLRAFELFEEDEPFDAIVCTDQRRESAVRAACAYASRRPLPLIVSAAPRSAVTDPLALAYELDYKRLAHRIVKALLARLETRSPLPPTLFMENNGFRNQMPVPQLTESNLRMLTMASPSTTALKRLLPHLEKSTGIHLELTVLPSLRDVYEVIQSSGSGRYDLIRMDVAWMDELAKKLFRPLHQIPFDWDRLLAQTLPEFGDSYTSVNGERICVPYDPSTQLMFYRRDLFCDPTYKRMYFEAYRRELEVPKSFEDYNRIAGFFTRSLNPASPVQYGTTVAIGNVVVSPSEFLPRLFEQGGKLFNAKGQITVDTPEALAALKNYRETYACSDRTVHDIWKNVLEGFADGSAAMTVVFINYASHILNSKMSSIAGKLGFAPVPGGKPLSGGGVGGNHPKLRAPGNGLCVFVLAVFQPDRTGVHLTGGVVTLPFGIQQPGHQGAVSLAVCGPPQRFPAPSAGGGSAYYSNVSELQMENILAAYVQRAVLGVCTPEEALAQALAEMGRTVYRKFESSLIMARLRVKKRKEKHGKHAVFFFYAPCALPFSFPKTCRYHRNKAERTLAITSNQFNAPAGPRTAGPSVRKRLPLRTCHVAAAARSCSGGRSVPAFSESAETICWYSSIGGGRVEDLPSRSGRPETAFPPR